MCMLFLDPSPLDWVTQKRIKEKEHHRKKKTEKKEKERKLEAPATNSKYLVLPPFYMDLRGVFHEKSLFKNGNDWPHYEISGEIVSL